LKGAQEPIEHIALKS